MKIRHGISAVLIAAILTLGLVGCGGGGGSGPSGPPPSNWVGHYQGPYSSPQASGTITCDVDTSRNLSGIITVNGQAVNGYELFGTISADGAISASYAVGSTVYKVVGVIGLSDGKYKGKLTVTNAATGGSAVADATLSRS